jgi:ribosomal protein S24E
MTAGYKPMVNHLTRISFQLVDNEAIHTAIEQGSNVSADTVRNIGRHILGRMERIAAMMELLTRKGFIFSAGKNYIYADSEDMEAQEAKHYLLSHGFQDQEFQVYLEYMRRWGVL